jgi:lipopolysaccharide export system protein LptA
MGPRFRPLFVAALTVLWAGLCLGMPHEAVAQGTSVGFSGFTFDPEQQVEVTADSLTVDQGNGNSVFSGNVVVGQGTMRLGAGELRIEYARSEDGSVSGIERLVASGGVTLAAGQEAAEAREAVYDIARRQIEMTGDVLLTQGPNALSGQRLVVNLDAGTGTMEGRVRTVLMPQAGPQQ